MEVSYNKSYYEKNKDKIKAQIYKKETCNLCKRMVSHQNMPKHKKSKLCLNNRITDPNMLTMINSLKEQIEELRQSNNTCLEQ